VGVGEERKDNFLDYRMKLLSFLWQEILMKDICDEGKMKLCFML
jgi:hypothetical protein